MIPRGHSGNRLYSNVGSVRPGRSVFDLSYAKKLTCDMGQLIPIMCDEVVPGDYWQIGNQAVVRFQPLVAPVLHEINMYVHYFFVPYRLLWDDWETFITGGIDGNDATPIPTWSPTLNGVGTLWDYLGFPIGVVPTGALPVSFPRDAYNLIYNEYYRDETLVAEELLTQESILLRCWSKDYFTSAQLTSQRGTPPALPIAGTSKAVWPAYNTASQSNVACNSATFAPYGAGDKQFLENNTVDLSLATAFDVSDLRLVVQIQRWMERNQRAGVRYTEFLQAHFGVAPEDARLQRPEYIGGSKSPIIISEVLQTSETDTSPQGNLAGHGISSSSEYCGCAWGVSGIG